MPRTSDIHTRNGASIWPMLYDLIVREVWENVKKKLDRQLAGKSRGDHLNGRDWRNSRVNEESTQKSFIASAHWQNSLRRRQRQAG